MKARISRTLSDPLRLTAPSLCFSLSLSFSLSVLLLSIREGASVDRPGGAGGSGGEEDGARGREAWERWERVGRSPDFLRGRGCWRSRDARMRQGIRTPGSRMRPPPSASRMFDVFFSHRSTLRRAPSSSLNTTAIARRSAATTTVPCNIRDHPSLADDNPRSVSACSRDRRRGR